MFKDVVDHVEEAAEQSWPGPGVEQERLKPKMESVQLVEHGVQAQEEQVHQSSVSPSPETRAAAMQTESMTQTKLKKKSKKKPKDRTRSQHKTAT